jgi:hypothetical protein
MEKSTRNVVHFLHRLYFARRSTRLNFKAVTKLSSCLEGKLPLLSATKNCKGISPPQRKVALGKSKGA